MRRVHLRKPYLIFTGDENNAINLKTALGVVDWRRHDCAGQLTLGGCAFEMGLPRMTPADAAAAGVGSVIIGTALPGGTIPKLWLDPLAQAACLGIDLVSGLHGRLCDIPALSEAAESSGVRLVDVRMPPADLPIATGKKRHGKRLLTVGTDCALGKKYTALQLEKDMRAVGYAADFRASGQTGILIAGEGIAIDSVIADFITGAAEQLSPPNEAEHWDVIEGQGSLYHPAYAPVSHGLLLGSQPDAFVVCHAAARTQLDGWPDFSLPTVDAVISRTLELGRLTNPELRCVGISVNTAALEASEKEAYLHGVVQHYALPAVDPMVNGTRALVENL